MGDPRHKKSPLPGDEEEITSKFREDANAMLKANATKNMIAELKAGDVGYLPCKHVDIARELKRRGYSFDKTMVRRILGSVKPSEKIVLLKSSTLIAPIRDILGLPQPVWIKLRAPASRERTLRWFAALPDDVWERYEAAVERERTRLDATES